MALSLVAAGPRFEAGATGPTGPTGIRSQTPSTVLLRDPALVEVSGCAVSRRRSDIIWLHNDSGDAPILYAVDIGSGAVRATFRVPGVEAVDWEDIAFAPTGELVIGDIGDNRHNRQNVLLHIISEPQLTDGVVAGTTSQPTTRVLRYPDQPHDAEALVVSPEGIVEIVAKDDGTVWRAPRGGGDGVLQQIRPRIGPGVTGADALADGSGILVRNYFLIWLLRRTAGRPFESAWSAKQTIIPAPFLVQAEAVCGDGASRFVYTTAERRGAETVPLVRVPVPARRGSR